MRILTFFVLIVLLASCASNDEVLTKNEEAALLEKMLEEIETLAASERCENAEEWAFTPIGSKACGGPTAYLAYSLNMDTELFLQKVEDYRIAQQAYNEKWGIVSDCMALLPPSGVECINGLPVLFY